ncbi:TetR/AcrR family transcriptional regulator [Herbiconiux flava]|uniref:AcrR family transcriptional regulator n=1 Tax=Herbiconiux flava TaxID=881268 RepID=A0A852SNU0_9MICO|nr:TetR/AcrR family transcriptional regulator [Herbiconiux flava]NYD70482.1 AcrR family transcriptional regulator [Herbiconiux flava]GLK17237.1 TetR family transcriptional regulator [Herbiconiux flava]
MSTALHVDPAPAPAGRVSVARERLVAVASELFYREGIHRVGMDRVLAEANVTRATMYRHFTGKEALVAAYLEREDAGVRGLFAAVAVTAGDDPRRLVELLIEAIADDVADRHDRGCPFINAAAEFPDAASPIRTIVTRHRAWFRATVRAALVAAHADADDAAGRPGFDADEAAATLVLLRDAALVGAYLDGFELVRPAFVSRARAAAGL